jgi:hypothetical protein
MFGHGESGAIHGGACTRGDGVKTRIYMDRLEEVRT